MEDSVEIRGANIAFTNSNIERYCVCVRVRCKRQHISVCSRAIGHDQRLLNTRVDEQCRHESTTDRYVLDDKIRSERFWTCRYPFRCVRIGT